MRLVNQKKLKNCSGFTLIELLVVITIIAILSSIGLLYYGDLQKRARDSARRTYLDQAGKALEVNKGNESYIPLQNDQFTSLNSVDPGGNAYCIAPDSTVPDPAFSVPWEGVCPAGFEMFAPGVPTTGSFISFKVCTYLELPSSGQPNVYCKSGTL